MKRNPGGVQRNPGITAAGLSERGGLGPGARRGLRQLGHVAAGDGVELSVAVVAEGVEVAGGAVVLQPAAAPALVHLVQRQLHVVQIKRCSARPRPRR